MGREMGGRLKTGAGRLRLIHVDIWQKTTESVKELSFN